MQPFIATSTRLSSASPFDISERAGVGLRKHPDVEKEFSTKKKKEKEHGTVGRYVGSRVRRLPHMAGERQFNNVHDFVK